MKTQQVWPAYTYLGMAEYDGQETLYDGNDSAKCEGSVEKVVGYLADLANQIEARMEDELKWGGRNGTWYSGAKAVQRIDEEIVALTDGSHFSLNPTKEEIAAYKREQQS